MKKIDEIIIKTESNSIYKSIFVLTLAFALIIVIAFLNIKENIKEKVEQNRKLTINNLEYTISLWIEDRIKSIESSVVYLGNNKIYQHEERIKKFNTNFLKLNKEFDTVQLDVENKYFFVNNKKLVDHHKQEVYGNLNYEQHSSLSWLTHTKRQMKTTIYEMKKHHFLKEQTINICTPILDSNNYKGVFCGILKTKSLFKKIKEIDIPENFSYFIVDAFGNSLTELYDKQIIEKIKYTCIEKSPQKISFTNENKTVNLKKIDRFDWYIGIIINESKFFKENMKKTFYISSFTFASFICFVLLVNILYQSILKKSKHKQQEYEKMLLHKSKLKEIGSLIAGINHQLKQPIHSLYLIKSSTDELLKRDELTKEILEENLFLFEKQILLMSNTIDIYKNFYKYNDTTAKFDLIECLKDIILVTKSNLSHYNITLQCNLKPEKIIIKSVKNFVYQVLLVLIQNAKDAILSQNNIINKNIILELRQDSKFANIDIIDHGCGVSKNMQKNIFSEIKKTKKKEGFGLGLYFAKKISVEKLQGDLSIVNFKNPTIFRLSLPKHTK